MLAIVPKLAASMTWVEGQNHAFFALVKFAYLCVVSYSRFWHAKFLFCVEFIELFQCTNHVCTYQKVQFFFPPKHSYQLSCQVLPVRLICHSPIKNRGLSVYPRPFSTSLMMKNIKENWRMHDQLLLLAAILTQWRHPVASSEALDLLNWAMCTVSYWRTATAIKMASKFGAFFHCCCVSCHPGGRQGNTEQIVAQWR